MAMTNADRQAAYKARKAAEGNVQTQVWIPRLALNAGDRDYSDRKALMAALDLLADARRDHKLNAHVLEGVLQALRPVLGERLWDEYRDRTTSDEPTDVDEASDAPMA